MPQIEARVQWAIGIAERELGHLDAAAIELRRDRPRRRGRGCQLSAGVKMTLALVIARLGDLEGAVETAGRRRASCSPE